MQKRICMQSSSLVKAWHYNCQWKRAKVLLETTTKMSYWKKPSKSAPSHKHVWLLHDNAPNHTSAIVTFFFFFFFFFFLQKEKITVLAHLTNSPDLASCDFFLFPKLKIFLAGWRYPSIEKPGSAVYQYLTSIPKFAYLDAFRKWNHQLTLCISSHGGVHWGHEIKKFVITDFLNIPDQNKQFFSNTPWKFQKNLFKQ